MLMDKLYRKLWQNTLGKPFTHVFRNAYLEFVFFTFVVGQLTGLFFGWPALLWINLIAFLGMGAGHLWWHCPLEPHGHKED